VDESLAMTLGNTGNVIMVTFLESLLEMVFVSLSVVVVIGIATPFFLVVFLPLGTIFPRKF
jgi:hypothetical protein